MTAASVTIARKRRVSFPPQWASNQPAARWASTFIDPLRRLLPFYAIVYKNVARNIATPHAEPALQSHHRLPRHQLSRLADARCEQHVEGRDATRRVGDS